MKFKVYTSKFWGTTTHVSDVPFAAIKPDGTIHLSGYYDADQLQEILDYAKSIATATEKTED